MYKVQKQTAGLTVLEVWSSGQITRGVIWDSIRGLVTLEHVRSFLQQNTYFGLVITCISFNWCKLHAMN